MQHNFILNKRIKAKLFGEEISDALIDFFSFYESQKQDITTRGTVFVSKIKRQIKNLTIK